MSRLYGFAVAALSVVLAAFSASTQAGAQGESNDYSASPASYYRWTGFNLAAGLGAGRFDYNLDAFGCDERFGFADEDENDRWNDLIANSPPVPGSGHPCYGLQKHAAFTNGAWNGFVTLQIGYDRLISDRLLIGAFADADIYFGSGEGFSQTWYDGGVSINGDLDLTSAWSLGAKIGVLVSPRVLLYGVGGYTQARVDGSVTANFWGNTSTASVDDNLAGWFFGGGAEMKLRQNVSLKLEYRYATYNGGEFYNRETYLVSGDDCYTYCGHNITSHGKFDAEIHSVRAAVVLTLDGLHGARREAMK